MKAQDQKSVFKVGPWFCQTEHKNHLVQFSSRRQKGHAEHSLFTVHYIQGGSYPLDKRQC